jgi:thiamine biosynthesis lipoprotein ApbE
MSRLPRIAHVLILVCSQIALVGCQHPLAPTMANQRPAEKNPAMVSAQATTPVRTAMQHAVSGEAEDCGTEFDLTECPKQKDDSQVPKVQKDPEHPIVEMGNDLVQLLKIFSGR